MRDIPLTQGKVAFVDDEDYEGLSQHKWQFCSSGGGYAKRTVRHGDQFETVRMHRVVIAAPPGLDVDHINGNGLDNRRSNLRVCGHDMNVKNRRPNRAGHSRYKGVKRNHNRWAAFLNVSGVRLYLGTFATEEEAARAYDSAALAKNPEYAFLNFPVTPQAPPA